MNEIKLQPYGVTKEMELLVNENFQLVKTFKNDLSTLHDTEDGKVAVTDILLGHFEDLFAQVNAKSMLKMQLETLSLMVFCNDK